MGTILIALSLLSVQTTFAQSSLTLETVENQGMQAAITARNDFVSALQNREYASVAHDGFEVAIQELADQIRVDYKDEGMAQELISHWTVSSPRFIGALTMRMIDLGDHSPLFPWITDFLKKASDKYGPIIYSLPLVKDIQMMNYALPVVFAPHGTWQTDGKVDDVDLRVEYRKHFIPFANLVTYYVAFYGCKYIGKKNGQDLTKICKMAAQKLQFAMGRYIAPVVSDWIFKAANRPLNIGRDQLRYTTADELRRAIRQ